MSKTKQLFITIAGCLALGTVLGVAFWLFDGGKQNNKIIPVHNVNCTVRTCLVQHKPIKIYRGRWIEDTQQVGGYWSVGYLQREAVK